MFQVSPLSLSSAHDYSRMTDIMLIRTETNSFSKFVVTLQRY